MANAADRNQQLILQEVVNILKDMTADWETNNEGRLGPETRLVSDLDFESIDVVQLVIVLEEHYQRRDFPFEKLLMNEGRYVDEIYVRDVVQFLHKHLADDSP